MIISCPECSSKFELPDNALGEKGRKVKCSSCTHVWRALPETDMPKAIAESIIESPPEPEPTSESDPLPTPLDEAQPSAEALRSRARSRGKNIRKDNSRTKKRARGALVAIILGALTFTLIIAKDKIISFVPESTIAYEAIGLEERPLEECVEIILPAAGINWSLEEQHTLIIEGEIKNLTNQAITLPPLIANLTRNGNILNTWTLTLDDPHLPANGTITYFQNLPNITTIDGQIELRFDQTQNIMDETETHTPPESPIIEESHNTQHPEEAAH